MSDSKKVLLIAPYFIPRRRVGSLRPFKFAIHLLSLGYTPVILTIGHQPDHLTPKERKMLGSIEILSIKSPLDRTSKTNKKGKNKEKTEYSLVEIISSWVDRHCPIDTWIFLFVLRWGWIKRVVNLTKPDLIMASGDPWSGLWLGEKLSKKFNVPFVADFRDPWTLGTLRLRERSKFSAGIDKIVERRVIKKADRLIFTSNQTNKLYTETYQMPSIKSTTIYNSFEPGLMKNSSDSSILSNWDDSKLNILFLGRFRRLSSTSLIVEILNHIQFSDPGTIHQIRVHSFGMPDKVETERIDEAGFNLSFIFHDPFDPEEALSIMNCADLLLLSTSRERFNIIPSKLWDYLFSEVPILSIVPNPEVGEIINETNAGVHFSPNKVVEISEFIIQAVRAKRSGLDLPVPNKKNMSTIREFTSKAATVKLATIFDELMN
tara:strand:+ start:71224 stop:72522 length:1299 start_codon:yes stop_codon:yes gene_type:complete